MKMPKTILVVISGKRKTHEALERALKFSEVEDANIIIFSAIYEPVIELTILMSSDYREALKQQYMSERYLYLESIATDLENKGIKSSVKLVWHRELHEAIEEAVIELKPDLVIKRIGADISKNNPFTMPVDRRLLRHCSAPLLLIKDVNWRDGPILAAVDPVTKDDAHIQLNHRILEYSKMLGEVSNCPIYVVSSYAVPSSNPAIDFNGVDYDLLHQGILQSYKTKLKVLLKSHDIPLENMHLVKGSAEQVIPKCVTETQSQLVVLGTVGRTGLSAAFIGNTAENILAELSCEVFTIKPQKLT